MMLGDNVLEYTYTRRDQQKGEPSTLEFHRILLVQHIQRRLADLIFWHFAKLELLCPSYGSQS
jgi:hypothetical protein